MPGIKISDLYSTNPVTVFNDADLLEISSFNGSGYVSGAFTLASFRDTYLVPTFDTAYVLKAGDTMTGTLILDPVSGGSLQALSTSLFENDVTIDLNIGEQFVLTYGQSTSGNTGNPVQIYDARGTGSGTSNFTTVTLSTINDRRGTMRGITQTIVCDDTGGTVNMFGHTVEFGSSATTSNGYGQVASVLGLDNGAAIFGTSNIDVASISVTGLWAAYLDGEVAVTDTIASHHLVDDTTTDFEVARFGTSNLSLWWSAAGSGTGYNGFWLDTGFQDEVGIDLYLNTLTAITDLNAGGNISGSTGFIGAFGSTTISATTIQGSPNLTIQAIPASGRTVRFGAYNTTTGIPVFVAALTSTSSTGTATHDLYTGVTIGSAYIYRVGGNDVSLADGGTNASLTANHGGMVYSTASALAIMAPATAGTLFRSSGAGLAPVTTTAIYPDSASPGSIMIGDGSNNFDNLAGNITPVKLFLSQTGNGVTANSPAWGLIAGTDISISLVDGTVIYAESGTLTGDPNNNNFLYDVSSGVLFLAETNQTGYINLQQSTELDSGTIPLLRWGMDTTPTYGGSAATLTWSPPSKFVPGGQLRLVDAAGSTFFNFRAANYYGTWAGTNIALASQVSGTLPIANGGTNATSYGANRVIFMNSGNTAFSSATGLTYDTSTLTLTTTAATGFRIDHDPTITSNAQHITFDYSGGGFGLTHKGLFIDLNTNTQAGGVRGIDVVVTSSGGSGTKGIAGAFTLDASSSGGNAVAATITGLTNGAAGYFTTTNAVTSGPVSGGLYSIYAEGQAYFSTLVGIGLTPATLLHVYQSDTSTTPQTRHQQNSTGDAAINFLLTGGQNYSMGIDNSDSDKFKLEASAALGTSTHLHMTTGGLVGIGIATAITPLHVADSDSASTTTTTGTIIAVESASTAYISFMADTGETNFHGITWGDSAANLVATISYQHSIDALFIYADLGYRAMFDTNGRVLFGVNDTTVSGNALFQIKTTTTWGQAALEIDQDDVDQEFIRFSGSSQANKNDNLSTLGAGAAGSASTGPDSGSWTHAIMIRCNANGTDYWIPAYT